MCGNMLPGLSEDYICDSASVKMRSEKKTGMAGHIQHEEV